MANIPVGSLVSSASVAGSSATPSSPIASVSPVTSSVSPPTSSVSPITSCATASTSSSKVPSAASSASLPVLPSSIDLYTPVASLDSSASVLGSSAMAGEPTSPLTIFVVAVGTYSLIARSCSFSLSWPTNLSTSSCETSTSPAFSNSARTSAAVVIPLSA